MSKSIKAVVVLGLITLVAACGSRDDEVVVVEPEPIMADPVSTKY